MRISIEEGASRLRRPRGYEIREYAGALILFVLFVEAVLT